MLYRSILLTLPVLFAFVSTAQAAGYLGVAVGDPSGDKAKGAAIVVVIADSPAEKIGLAEGDIVLAVDKVKIGGPVELVKAIKSLKAGEEVKLKVLREGKKRNVTVTLGERPESPTRPDHEGMRPFIGIACRPSISPDEPGTPSKLTVSHGFVHHPASSRTNSVSFLTPIFDKTRVRCLAAVCIEIPS